MTDPEPEPQQPEPGHGPDDPDTEHPLTAEDILARAGAGDALDQPAAGGSDSQASRLVALAGYHFRLVMGTDGRPYAVEHDGPAVAFTLRGRGGLRTRLANLYYDTYQQTPGGSGLTDALTVLEGQAERTDPVPVALRVGRAPGDRLVLDLGGADGHAVVIDPTDWRIVARSPVLFRRTGLTSPLPEPARGGTLDGLRALVNVDDAQWRLIVGWLVAALIPDIPHPILALTGEQGTAKSTAARLVVELVDPSTAPLRTPPKDMGSWAAGTAGSWVVALDNVSTIPQWFSDTLCKAVTGDGIVTRALFTDDDVNVLTFRRCIALTSIDAGRLAGDLAERLVPIELARIPDDQRRDDAEVAAAYTAARPAALGALLDLTARVLAALPAVRLTERPRMADFARVLAALDQLEGWDTLTDYRQAAAEANQVVLESSPVAEAIIDLIGRGGAWTGTPGELLDRITPDPRPRDWPRNARGLSGQLARLAPALRANGIAIDRPGPTGRDRRRIITLRATTGG
jgi:hypothetical protein